MVSYRLVHIVEALTESTRVWCYSSFCPPDGLIIGLSTQKMSKCHFSESTKVYDDSVLFKLD